MRRVRTTTAVLFLGAVGGLVSGLLVSFGAVVFGPDAIPAGAPNVADVVILAAMQGVTVGTPLGVILGPLAYLGLGAGTPPLRLALFTGMATVILGNAFAAFGGAPAGLAGGLIGFYAAAVLAGRARARGATRGTSGSPRADGVTIEPAPLEPPTSDDAGDAPGDDESVHAMATEPEEPGRGHTGPTGVGANRATRVS